jgi:hypothetical protein
MNNSQLRVIRSGIDRLDDGDVAGGEGGFAVFEVVVPGASECNFIRAKIRVDYRH